MSADDLLARAKEFYERGTKLTEGIVLVGELAAEVERLRAERDALRSVVRRYRDGWTDLPFGRVVRWCREGPTVDDPDLIRRWEPMTPAEADAIRNAIEGTGQPVDAPSSISDAVRRSRGGPSPNHLRGYA